MQTDGLQNRKCLFSQIKEHLVFCIIEAGVIIIVGFI